MHAFCQQFNCFHSTIHVDSSCGGGWLTYLSADCPHMPNTCKNNKNKETSSLSEPPHGCVRIAHNESTSPVAHRHYNVIPLQDSVGGRNTSAIYVYSSSPWFSWAVKSLSGWHEEIGPLWTLMSLSCPSLLSTHSQETFIVQTVWRCKLEISICIALNSSLASQL